MSEAKVFNMVCPFPFDDHSHIKLGHGGGGRLMQQLIDDMFIAAFDNPILRQGHDGAVLTLRQESSVLTTDSYVVRPLFFPGGDIGSLAVNGTVNDLAMCGAQPLFLTASFILEEGLAMETLWRVVRSMRVAADAANLCIVSGDTKVVERGHGDGIYINTTGLGQVVSSAQVTPKQITPGDTVLVSGDIGRHGMAVMGEREGLAFEPPIESDCASLWDTVQALLAENIDIHCMRDATRGGLCAVLNELAKSAGMQFSIEEAEIPVADCVRGACEVLGFDPLHIANEGRFIVIVPESDAQAALDLLQTRNPYAAMIGRVTDGEPGLVALKTAIGGQRVLDLPAGELLPRIC